MLFFDTLIVILLPLTTFASTQFAGKPYLLTTLNAHSVSNSSFALPNNTTGSSNITVQFTLYDPDPLTNASTPCSATWSVLNGSYPNLWVPCKNQAFGWKFEDWNGVGSFGLAVKHNYKDPRSVLVVGCCDMSLVAEARNSVGQPPYDYVTTFARGSFNSTNLKCFRARHGDVSCALASQRLAALPIYAAVA